MPAILASRVRGALLATLLLGSAISVLVIGADVGSSAGITGATLTGTGITPSPAFAPTQLVQLPTNAWPTNGGNLYNQRYSPLKQLDRDNVKELKAVWRASLRGSGLDTKTSGQATMLEWEGVLYVVTGMDDVFAISVDTGAVLWQYQANLDPEKVRVCCGWAARGVGMGDGRIYVGQLDSQVVALDQKTGKGGVAHAEPDAGRWPLLHHHGAAVLRRHGDHRPLGGDMGIRGVIKALDARTGAERWRWYTIPGPGEAGHETWPSYNDSWKYGGGAVWSTPAVDPELGSSTSRSRTPGRT